MKISTNTLRYFVTIFALLTAVSCGKKRLKQNVNHQDSTKISQPVDKKTELLNRQIEFQKSDQKYLSDYKKHLDSLFTQKKSLTDFKEIGERGEILIGNLFTISTKYAIITYQTTDSTLKVDVLKSTQDSWDTVLQHECISFFDDPAGLEIIDINDFNGDNQVDLRIIHQYWHIYPGEHSLLWLYKNEKFEFINGFDEIVTPEYDKKTNRIYSYQSDGCEDMDMQFVVYEMNGAEIKEIDDIFCECCDCANGNCTITRKGKSKSISIDKLHLSFPDYFKDMIKYKTGLCKEGKN